MPPKQNPQMPSADYSLKKTFPNIGGGRVLNNDNLTTAFDLVEKMHIVYVRVVRAKGLPGINADGTCDPFVEVKIGNYKGTTNYVEKNPNPEWNQVFAFSKDHIHATMGEILVRNKEFVNDEEILGRVLFYVSEVPSRVPPDSSLAPEWHRLEGRNGLRVQGELMLAIWMGNQADEAFPDAWHSDVLAISGEHIANTRSKVYLSPRLWYLRVNVIEAQDLVLRDQNRRPEAYVKGILGTIVLRSRVSPKKSVNPTWNEDLIFVVAEPFDEPLILSVEDKLGADKDECLGRCVVPLQMVENRDKPIPVSHRWYGLEKTVVNGEETKVVRLNSRLHLRVSFDGGYHVFDESTHYNSDLRAASKLLWTPPIGVLELGILNAEGLQPTKNKDGRGTVDAYCVAKYGQKWVRTRTIVDSFAPKWNEQYTWEVYDPCTVITIGVFENCHIKGDGGVVAKDPRIGKVRIRLSTLKTDRIYTHSYPLLVLQNTGVKKMGEIQLAVRFTCTSLLNMLQTYTEPLLPKMHYLHPLTVYQLDSLRHQATYTISMRLGRAEPPLRKEVVEYMLDVGVNMWSLRRGRANFARIIRLFNVFFMFHRWFNEICKWKNATKTIATHFLLMVLVFFPCLILPTFFLSLFTVGIWNYRKRPRYPPHMDTQFSYADTAQNDELDEEFDTFPSSKGGEVLKARYDRLRSIAGRMQTVLGDLATQGERVQSLLTWRDPRATFMFVIFCLIAAILIYVIPFRMMIIFVVFYTLRHPKFRIDIPAVPQNFLRRLPAKTDSLL
ncbi:FT-interacting protein 3-like [Tripterygium wilfordii]|nr:FT-interacting protein 3-like [Tripterygium wilfordii]XP_038707564.1 FT-interacting protein 3-like [Tripterygium wilfordii]